jgi:Holliday junction DNA helicase RuvA
MIDHLQGELVSRGPTSILLALGPVRVEITVPLSTSRELPADGAPAAVWTHLVWKEEGPQLFGFARRRERDLFRLLLGVQGVGPTGAISLLSHLSAPELLAQIRQRSIEGLTRVPRIGAKTAGRILVDLGPRVDRMGAEELDEGGAASAPIPSPGLEDAVQALAALGYSSRDARRAVELVHQDEAGLPLDEQLRRALHRLARRDG